MRRSLTLLTPIAAGAVALALAVAYPSATVRGSALTGPKIPKSIANVRLDKAYRVRWADHARAIELRVRDGAVCAPKVSREASTGPARLEVTVDRPTGPACLPHPRWWDFRLAPPPIRAKHQAVTVFVNGDWASVGPPRA